MSHAINCRRLALVLILLSAAACTPRTSDTFDPVTMDIPSINASHPPFIRELNIPANGVQMSGFLLGANGAGPHPTVVLLHGYPGNEKNLDLAQSMRRAGFNVLFFHYRGAWGSEGSFSLVNIADDVGSALSYLRSEAEALRVDTAKLTIVGHSMGGFAALRAAANDADVACVAGIAAANLGEYAHVDNAAQQQFKRYTDSLFVLANFDGAQALREIAENATAFDATRYGEKLRGKAVLLISGEQDKVVPPAVQQRIATAYARVDGLSVSAEIMQGDHSFSTTRIALQRTVIDWARANCAAT